MSHHGRVRAFVLWAPTSTAAIAREAQCGNQRTFDASSEIVDTHYISSSVVDYVEAIDGLAALRFPLLAAYIAAPAYPNQIQKILRTYMKSLPNEDQLQEGFVDFSMLSFELLGRADKDHKYLKFAAVNAQIALELFLKYYFAKKGRVDQIRKKKNGVEQNEYIDFSQILNLYYSTRTWSFGVKRELVDLLDARNSILHKAQHTGSLDELAINVVKTLYFIHSTWHSDFGGLLFERSYGLPSAMSKNKMWRKGVHGFVKQLESVHKMDVRPCLACQQRTVITGEFFGLVGAEGMEYLICLNCFDSLDVEHEVRLIKCHICHNHTYIVEALNEQKQQLYAGKCTACHEDSFVRRCIQCEDFYHPENGEFNEGGKYFCSSGCLEYASDRF